MKNTLMTILAFTMFSACAVDPGPATRDDLGSTEQALTGYTCTQQCADGTVHTGSGSTPDEAYQNLQGCGPGGGDISCNPGAPLED